MQFVIVFSAFFSSSLCRIELTLNSTHDRLQQQVYSWPDTLSHHQGCFWSDETDFTGNAGSCNTCTASPFSEGIVSRDIRCLRVCVKRFYRKVSHSSEWEEIWNWGGTYVTWCILSLYTHWFVLLGQMVIQKRLSFQHQPWKLSVNLTFLWKCVGTFRPLLKPIYGIVCDYSLYQWRRLL